MFYFQTQGLRTSSTKFLFAKCAIDLDKDFEAENVLQGRSIDPRREVRFLISIMFALASSIRPETSISGFTSLFNLSLSFALFF